MERPTFTLSSTPHRRHYGPERVPRLLAASACPYAWEHCVKPQVHADPRMSLTFRHIEDNGGEILGRRTFSAPATT